METVQNIVPKPPRKVVLNTDELDELLGNAELAACFREVFVLTPDITVREAFKVACYTVKVTKLQFPDMPEQTVAERVAETQSQMEPTKHTKHPKNPPEAQ